MFGATFNLVTRVGLPPRDGSLGIVQQATETSSKMTSTLCQKGFKTFNLFFFNQETGFLLESSKFRVV